MSSRVSVVSVSCSVSVVCLCHLMSVSSRVSVVSVLCRQCRVSVLFCVHVVLWQCHVSVSYLCRLVAVSSHVRVMLCRAVSVLCRQCRVSVMCQCHVVSVSCQCRVVPCPAVPRQCEGGPLQKHLSPCALPVRLLLPTLSPPPSVGFLIYPGHLFKCVF